MTNLVSLLNEIRQLAPAGSPLYSFRHSDEQQTELVRLLRHEFELGHRDRHVAAGFCLAASRILSTQLQKGEWSWRPVNEALVKLYNPGPFIKQGLDYWGRPVVVLETHRWLFTLVAEGGLPIHLVQEQGSLISSFFARLLALAETTPNGDVADELPRCFGMLPESLRNDAVRQLSIDLIRLLRELRATTEGEMDRLAFLDRERPEWRRRLPLLVDDETSRGLLSGLLDAPKQLRSMASGGIPVVTTLSRRASEVDEYSIAQAVQLPAYVSRVGLGRQLGLDIASLPKRFSLNLVDLDGTSTPLATVTVASDDNLFHLETGRRSVRLGKIGGPVLLQATRQGVELGPAVRVSQELGDMPWVFADDEADQELLSVGPYSTARQSVLVAATDSASVQPLEDEVYDSAAILVGMLLDEDRYLYRVHGKVRVQVAGELFSVRTGATHDESFSVLMRGPRLSLPSGLVWRGVPRFFMDGDHGERELRASAISWRAKGSVGDWRAVGRDCVGEVQVRVRWQGQVIHRSSECILPSQLTFELKPEERGGRGTLAIAGIEHARVAAGDPEDGLTLEIGNMSGSVSVRCRASGECTAVPLRFKFGTTSLSARFPFPGYFVGFVDAAGRPLEPGAHLDVARLHGVRARALEGGRSGEFLLLGRATKMPEVALATLTRGAGGVAELSLGHIQEQIEALLSDGLDATAEIHLAPKGGVVRGAARNRGIKVHWYGNRLVRHFEMAVSEEEEEGERASLVTAADVPISLKSPNDSDVPVRVFAHRMTDPAMEGRQELPGDEEAGWKFVSEGREPGPWIVTGWRGEALLCRPSLVLVPGTDADTETTGEASGVDEVAAFDGAESAPTPMTDLSSDSVPLESNAEKDRTESSLSLQQVVQHPSWAERRRLMEAAVSRMAVNASHPDWSFAQGFLDSMKMFPADSYEFNRAVFQRPEATALAVLRAAFLNQHEHLWAGFEQFHFLWVTFPLRAWTRAVRTYRDTAFPGVPEDSRGPLLKLVLDRCFATGETTQYRSVIWDLCGRTIYGVPPAPNPIRMPDGEQRRKLARLIAQDAMGQSEQQHADEQYPQLPDTTELLSPSLAGTVEALTPNVQMGFRRDVARAPVLAAAISVHALEPSRVLLFELRRVRDFDSKYFDSVYNDSLACLALDALDQDHEHFN